MHFRTAQNHRGVFRHIEPCSPAKLDQSRPMSQFRSDSRCALANSSIAGCIKMSAFITAASSASRHLLPEAASRGSLHQCVLPRESQEEAREDADNQQRDTRSDRSRDHSGASRRKYAIVAAKPIVVPRARERGDGASPDRKPGVDESTRRLAYRLLRFAAIRLVMTIVTPVGGYADGAAGFPAFRSNQKVSVSSAITAGTATITRNTISYSS